MSFCVMMLRFWTHRSGGAEGKNGSELLCNFSTGVILSVSPPVRRASSRGLKSFCILTSFFQFFTKRRMTTYYKTIGAYWCRWDAHRPLLRPCRVLPCETTHVSKAAKG